jgi:hypothetical protein
VSEKSGVNVTAEDIEAIQKTNWIDGFRWGILLGGVFVLFLELTIQLIGS